MLALVPAPQVPEEGTLSPTWYPPSFASAKVAPLVKGKAKLSLLQLDPVALAPHTMYAYHEMYSPLVSLVAILLRSYANKLCGRFTMPAGACALVVIETMSPFSVFLLITFGFAKVAVTP